MDYEPLPDEVEGRAQLLQTILLAACEGDRHTHNHTYVELRREMMNDSMLKPLLPDFIRTCRDLSHFWGYIRAIDGQWEPRRQHVRTALTPLFDHIEGKNRVPADVTVSDVLQRFDPEGVHALWQKALDRRHADPEGAITAARTLLETVCKHILDKAGPSCERGRQRG
jgi:hypothetical protein